MRRIIAILGLTAALALSSGAITTSTAQDRAAQHPDEHAVDWQTTPIRLLMVEQRGCIYCARWNEEIGTGYGKSAEGQTAPLLRVDIDGPWPDGLAIGARPNITPTFILLDHGSEVGRMTGYVGDNHFYPLLDEMLDQLPAPGATESPSEAGG